MLWGCEWLLVARTLLLPPSVATAGCAGWQVGWEQSTGHSYLNQGFDAPSSKHPTLKHLGKPFLFPSSQKTPSPYLLMAGQVIPESSVLYQHNGGGGLAVIPRGQAMVMLKS